jgi:3-dehydroquinate dehydratase
MPIEEIYEVYHNAEEMICMSVIEKEIERCTKLMNTLKDQDMKYAMEGRVDVLKMTQESTQSDFQNEFLTP